MADMGPIGELGKVAGDVAKTLIERVDGALQRSREPRLIERMARAEAKAEMIRAQGQIETQDLRQRAAHRLLQEEMLNQANIEAVLAKAAPHVLESANLEGLSDDWLRLAVDKVKFVSEEDAQDVWGRLIAGEANRPGSYSTRALETLATMDQHDAVSFELLGSFSVGHPSFVPVILELNDPIYSDGGLSLDVLINLEELGLLNFNPMGGYLRTSPSQVKAVQYFGEAAILELKDKGDKAMYALEVGQVVLTRVGVQLSPLVSPKPTPGFLDYISKAWEANGHKVTRPNLVS